MQPVKTILLILTLWQILCLFGHIPPYILPPPLDVIVSFYTHKNLIAYHAGISGISLLLGLFFAIAAGSISAVGIYYSKALEKLLQPLFLIFQSTPGFVLFPLFVAWFGYGILSKVMVIALSCYFPICLCFWDALKHPPADLVELGHTFHGTRSGIFWHVRLPAALPGLLSGLKLAAIHAPITTLASEWIGAQSGLGYLIMLTHGRLEIDFMFATIIVIIALTNLFSWSVRKLQEKVLFWSW